MSSSTTPLTDSNTKCPCCNNPWAAATSELFAKLCSECTTNNKDNKENDKSNSSLKQYLDESISPSDDFYHYANGTWIKDNPIPSGYPNWNTFLQLFTLSQERLKDLLTKGGDEEKDTGEDVTENEANDDVNKVKAFYNAAMDEGKIEELGIEPLCDLLKLCENVAAVKDDPERLAECLGQLIAEYGVSSFFSIGECFS